MKKILIGVLALLMVGQGYGLNKQFVQKITDLLPLHKAQLQKVAGEIDNYEKLIAAENIRLARGGTYSENSQEYMKELQIILQDKRSEFRNVACEGLDEAMYLDIDWEVLGQ